VYTRFLNRCRTSTLVSIGSALLAVAVAGIACTVGMASTQRKGFRVPLSRR
jgi:hypothetical protein